MAIYLFVFIAILYWVGWIRHQLDISLNGYSSYKGKIAGIVIVTVCLAMTEWSSVPLIRNITEILDGRIAGYSQHCIDFYEQIEASDEDIVYIDMAEVDDNTCIINPKINVGYYDYEKEHANRTIARFYGKTAVYYNVEDDK